MVLVIVRTDIVLEAVAFSHMVLHVELKARFLAGSHEVVNDTETFYRIHFRADGSQTAEVGDEICSYPGKIYPGILNAFFVYGYRDVLVLNDGIGAGGLFHKHLVVFLTVFVESVIFHVDQDLLLEIRPVQPAVVDGDLSGASAVQCIQKLRVFQEHGFLVLPGSHRIVDVLELVGHGILVFPGKKNPVRPYGADGNDVLDFLRDLKAFFVLLQDIGQCFDHIRFSLSLFSGRILSSFRVFCCPVLLLRLFRLAV